MGSAPWEGQGSVMGNIAYYAGVVLGYIVATLWHWSWGDIITGLAICVFVDVGLPRIKRWLAKDRAA